MTEVAYIMDIEKRSLSLSANQGEINRDTWRSLGQDTPSVNQQWSRRVRRRLAP